MPPQEFIAKWGPGGPSHRLNERQGAKPRFIDLCQLLGDEVLKRLLALDLERSANIQPQ